MSPRANYISSERLEVVLVDPSLGPLLIAGPLLIGLVGLTLVAASLAPEAYGQVALIELSCLAVLAVLIGAPRFDFKRLRFLSTPKHAFVINKDLLMAPDDRLFPNLWSWPERIAWLDVQSMKMEHRPLLATGLLGWPFSSHLVLQLKSGRVKRTQLPWITGSELDGVVSVLAKIAELHGVEARLHEPK